jgi:Fe-S-cluster-containing dehydrogenase component
MRKILLIDYRKCTGCMACMLACPFAHCNEFSLNKSRIVVHKEESKAIFIPSVCESCKNRLCIENCPVNCLTYDENLGIVRIDEESCTGCGRCKDVCPYYGVGLDSTSKKALICDLCGGNPECAKVCPTSAISFVEYSEGKEKEKFDLASERVIRINEIRDDYSNGI